MEELPMELRRRVFRRSISRDIGVIEAIDELLMEVREEILTAQMFLREWYGIAYEPRLTNDAIEAIEHLEETEAGRAFDIEFMEIFSHHHFMIVQAATECLVASELRHHGLGRLCRGFIENQMSDIDEMRHLLCEKYGICDYQPLEGMEGRHS